MMRNSDRKMLVFARDVLVDLDWELPAGTTEVQVPPFSTDCSQLEITGRLPRLPPVNRCNIFKDLFRVHLGHWPFSTKSIPGPLITVRFLCALRHLEHLEENCVPES